MCVGCSDTRRRSNNNERSIDRSPSWRNAGGRVVSKAPRKLAIVVSPLSFLPSGQITLLVPLLFVPPASSLLESLSGSVVRAATATWRSNRFHSHPLRSNALSTIPKNRQRSRWRSASSTPATNNTSPRAVPDLQPLKALHRRRRHRVRLSLRFFVNLDIYSLLTDM